MTKQTLRYNADVDKGWKQQRTKCETRPIKTRRACA
jgi:hypothetical protein